MDFFSRFQAATRVYIISRWRHATRYASRYHRLRGSASPVLMATG